MCVCVCVCVVVRNDGCLWWQYHGNRCLLLQYAWIILYIVFTLRSSSRCTDYLAHVATLAGGEDTGCSIAFTRCHSVNSCSLQCNTMWCMFLHRASEGKPFSGLKPKYLTFIFLIFLLYDQLLYVCTVCVHQP